MDPLLPGVSPLARFRLPRLAPLLLCIPLLSSCSVQRSIGALQAPLTLSSGPALGSGPSPVEKAPSPHPMPSPLPRGRAPVYVPGPLPIVGLVIALAYSRHFKQVQTQRQRVPSGKEPS